MKSRRIETLVDYRLSFFILHLEAMTKKEDKSSLSLSQSRISKAKQNKKYNETFQTSVSRSVCIFLLFSGLLSTAAVLSMSPRQWAQYRVYMDVCLRAISEQEQVDQNCQDREYNLAVEI